MNRNEVGGRQSSGALVMLGSSGADESRREGLC